MTTAREWMTSELRSPGTRDAIVTLAGNLGRLTLGFAASVILARALGPEAYGLIALVSIFFGIADTVGDFGLTYSAIRTIARAPDRARSIANGYLSLALLGNAAAAAVAIVFAEPIARLGLGRPEAEPYVRLAALGLLATAGSGFASAVLQSTRRFGQLAALQIVTAVTYLIGILVLVATGHLTVTTVVILGTANPLIGFATGVWLLPPGFVSLGAMLSPSARRAWGDLVAFGKWMWGSTIFSLLALQLDLLMLSHWTSASVVGVYALAFNLATKMDILNQTRLTVLLPHVSALRSRQEAGAHLRQSLPRSLLLAGILVLTVPFLRPFIVTFYGPSYGDAVNILYAFTLVVIFDLVVTPAILLAFPLDQAKTLAASDVLRVIVLLASGWFLIPALGPIGAVLARLLSRIAGAAFTLAALANRLRSAHRMRIA